MRSFDNLLKRISVISEAKVSPYASAHPAFGPITSKMKAGGLSSAPLDTIKFIRDTLYYMDILNDDELNTIKRAPGFTGKKQAMLAALAVKQDVINQQKDEIAARIEDTLDDFINGIGVNRGREEKYAAQAAANEIAKEVRKTKSGKQLDDALIDTISTDTILVKASIAKILSNIQANLGDPGFDIEPDALEEVFGYAEKINSLTKLKSFIKQIANEPGYEKIAAYLSSAVKPIERGTEDEEMVDDEDEESGYQLRYREEEAEDEGTEFPMSAGEEEQVQMAQANALAAALGGKSKLTTESYTANYMDELITEKIDFEKLKTKGKQVGKAAAAAAGLAAGVAGLTQVAPRVYEKGKEVVSDIMKTGGNEEFLTLVTNQDDKDKLINKLQEVKSMGTQAEMAPGSKMGGLERVRNELRDLEQRLRLTYRIPPSIQLHESIQLTTAMYLTEQVKTDRPRKTIAAKNLTFKEKYQPKTYKQLEELRRYGL